MSSEAAEQQRRLNVLLDHPLAAQLLPPHVQLDGFGRVEDLDSAAAIGVARLDNPQVESTRRRRRRRRPEARGLGVDLLLLAVAD